MAYVDRRSARLDARILLTTAAHLWRRDGITDDGGVTMAEFTGTGTADLAVGRA